MLQFIECICERYGVSYKIINGVMQLYGKDRYLAQQVLGVVATLYSCYSETPISLVICKAGELEKDEG